MTWLSRLMLAITAMLAPCGPPLAAHNGERGDELRLQAPAIIQVKVNGIAIRLEVDPGLGGPVILNAQVAETLKLKRRGERGWDFGSLTLSGHETKARLVFETPSFKRSSRASIAWTPRQASLVADGVIGVHHLPWDRVTFLLGKPSANERASRVKLVRRTHPSSTRLGTEVEVGEDRLFVRFSLDQPLNLVTARTANFIATHQEGAFVKGSEREVQMVFDVPAQTREMRLAYPIELGDLRINSFAVRVKNHGRPSEVGAMERDDPRFQDGAIIVTRRKRKGRDDLLTSLGRDQLQACSRLTFAKRAKVVELSCSTS